MVLGHSSMSLAGKPGDEANNAQHIRTPKVNSYAQVQEMNILSVVL